MGTEGRNVPTKSLGQEAYFAENVFPMLSQAWGRLLLTCTYRCMSTVKHKVFFQTIFLCLPVPRGRISIQRIKMELHLETISQFDFRQDAAEKFPYTLDNFQLISVGAGWGLHKITNEEEDSDDKMKEQWSYRILVLCNSNQWNQHSIWWLKVCLFIKQALAYTTVLLWL